MKSVKIVGAGLVGSLLGILLRKRGWSVDVFERRSDPRQQSLSAGRSINLIITSRGLHGLERAGLREKGMALSVPVFGRMIHGLDGSTFYQPYGREGECNYSISRSELNHFLIDAAEKAGVRFHFERTLEKLDPAKKRAEFSGSHGAEAISYDLLFGADGAGSRVRTALCELEPSRYQASVEWLDADYKEMFMPAKGPGVYQIQKDALHIWPRGAVMMMALANRDGSFTMTLYMPRSNRPLTFDQIKSEPDFEKFFSEQFPDAVELMPDRTKDFFNNPQGTLGTVRLNKWTYGDSIALLGDAAHAIVPFFGQGMNSGFEDCTVLDDLINQGFSGEKLLAAYEGSRLPNARAIADMAIENWFEMADRVGDAKFQLRKKVESLIEKRFPSLYRSRYGMICYTLIPYAEAQKQGEIQTAFLEQLCAGINGTEELNWPEIERLLPTVKM